MSVRIPPIFTGLLKDNAKWRDAVNRTTKVLRQIGFAQRIQYMDSNGAYTGPTSQAISFIADTGGVAAGDICAVTGYDSTTGYMKLDKADADSGALAKNLWWSPSAVTAAATGYARKSGMYTSAINTSGATVGDAVYLSETDGGLSLTEPATSTDVIVKVGTVATLDGSAGIIAIDLGGGESIAIHDHADNAGGGALVVTGTTSTSFEIDTDGTIPAMALGVGTTGDFTITLSPIATLTANRAVTFQDAAGIVTLSSSKQSLTLLGSTSGGIALSPTATGTNNFTIANQACSVATAVTLPNQDADGTYFAVTANADGSIASTAATGTTATAFEVDTDGVLPAIAIGVGTTGDFTQTIKPAATLTAGDADITIPDTAGAAGVFVLEGSTQTLIGKTLTAPVVNSGTLTGTLTITTPTVTGTWTNLGSVDTVDINGGTIDGANIGAAAAGTGAFSTLSSSGATTAASLICTAGATFGGGFGTTGTTISTAGAISTDGVTTVQLNDTDNTVSNALVLIHSSSDNTAVAGDGVGISFHLENAAGTAAVEEWASLDVENQTTTAGAEDVKIVFKGMLAGGAVGGGVPQQMMALEAVNQAVVIGRDATDANGINSLRIYANTASNGYLSIAPTAAGGDFWMKLTNATFGQNSTYTIPDAGATDSFAMLSVANVFSGANTFASITGNDASLGIAGLAGSAGAGGIVAFSSGAGDGAGNAGGAITTITGAGAAHTSGTGGDSGAVTVASGAAGTATTGQGGDSGLISLTTAAGGAASGATSTGGASGAISITSGTGGAADNASACTGGAGGTIAIAGGSGGTADNAASTAGNGADITMYAGTGGTSAGGAAGDGGSVTIRAGSGATAGAIAIGGTNALTTTIGRVGAVTTVQSSALVLDSTAAMVFQISAIDILEIDDSAINMAAATATGGHACYVGTEAGGVATTTGSAGGLLNITTGAGSDADTTQTAGVGAALALATGIGGNSTTGTAGASGAITIASGTAGGTTTSGVGPVSGDVTISTGTGGIAKTAANGGAAGTISLLGGTGGEDEGAANVGGAGAAITLLGGTGGAGATGGAGGAVTINGGAVGAGGSPSVGAINIGATNAGAIAIGKAATAASVTTLNGAVKGEAEGYMVHCLVVDASVAEINAGHDLVTVPANRQFQLVDLKQIAIGGTVGTTTSIEVSVGANDLTSTTAATLADSAVIQLDTSGVTVLTDGTSFSAQAAGGNLAVSKTGGNADTATDVRFIISYMLV